MAKRRSNSCAGGPRQPRLRVRRLCSQAEGAPLAGMRRASHGPGPSSRRRTAARPAQQQGGDQPGLTCLGSRRVRPARPAGSGSPTCTVSRCRSWAWRSQAGQPVEVGAGRGGQHQQGRQPGEGRHPGDPHLPLSASGLGSRAAAAGRAGELQRSPQRLDGRWCLAEERQASRPGLWLMPAGSSCKQGRAGVAGPRCDASQPWQMLPAASFRRRRVAGMPR